MSLALIRAEYKTILEGVPNIGIVHRYPRLATDWGKFLELFKDSQGKIRGWEIAIAGATGARKYLSGVSPNAVADLPWNVVIRGYSGLRDADATAETFDDLVQSILQKFLPLHDLNGKALSASEMIAETIEERLFGGVLAHYVELKQTAWDRVTY